jgi:hypothetical protein
MSGIKNLQTISSLFISKAKLSLSSLENGKFHPQANIF